jgi:molybdate/tungstate transport system substrate-binding protein
MRWLRRLGAVFALLALMTGCGAATAPSHVVDVAYAGSLAYLMDQQVGPGFQHVAHLTYQGRGGGSLGLAQEIRAGTIPADVFVSIGTGPIAVLGPRAPWAIGFATAPLVIAYNPHSRFAPELRALANRRLPIQDLFTLMAQPGFRLGRTNPNTDPQGQAFYMMVELAQRVYGLPPHTAQHLLGAPDNPAQVFSETGILSQLQSGNLDASSAFLPEALEHRLPYIALPPALNFSSPEEAVLYGEVSVKLADGRTVVGQPLSVDVTVVNRSANGVRFVRYLLSHPGPWQKDGYVWTSPRYWGNVAAIPASLRHGLG